MKSQILIRSLLSLSVLIDHETPKNNAYAYAFWYQHALAGTTASFHAYGVALDPTSTFALVVDANNGGRILRLDISTAEVTSLAGSPAAGGTSSVDGVGSGARFSDPYSVAIHPTKNFALVTELGAGKIRMIEISSGNVSTLAVQNNSPVQTDTLCIRSI